ncbi:MAG: alpha/beta fold hydrolase [Thermoleophilia bacterium]
MRGAAGGPPRADDQGRTMTDLTVNGARLHVEELGAGPPLVLVHGLGGTGRGAFGKVLDELAASFHVVLPDLRGSGRSETTSGPYTIEQLADDLDGLLVALDLGPVALAGHSMGGSIVLLEAARRPERVASLIAIGAPVELPEAGRDGMRARAETVESEGMAAVATTVATNGLAPSFREARPAELAAFVSLLEAADPVGYAAQCRALATMAITGELARIEAPTLFLCGERDAVSPPALNRDNAALVAGSRVVELPDTAHIIPWERPSETAAAIAEHAR